MNRNESFRFRELGTLFAVLPGGGPDSESRSIALSRQHIRSVLIAQVAGLLRRLIDNGFQLDRPGRGIDSNG